MLLRCVFNLTMKGNFFFGFFFLREREKESGKERKEEKSGQLYRLKIILMMSYS